jgi:hypothetical protein
VPERKAQPVLRVLMVLKEHKDSLAQALKVFKVPLVRRVLTEPAQMVRKAQLERKVLKVYKAFRV